MRRLLVDSSNLLFRVHAANQRFGTGGGTPKDLAGLAMHQTLMSLRSQYNKYNPDKVLMTFEGGANWRKDFTKASTTARPYKGNRIKDESMVPFFELIDAFKKLAIEHTTLTVAMDPKLEGDDVIAGAARRYSAAGDEVIILSDDKDFCTLLQLPNVRLIRPDGTERKLGKDKMPEDAGFFMYEKAFRGDGGDNVMPALPRVYSSKLRKAYDNLKAGNSYDHTNLLNTTWELAEPSTGELRTILVKDVFHENLRLMDLLDYGKSFGLPPLELAGKTIDAYVDDVITNAEASAGSFNLFQFQKFCGKFELKKISENVVNFVPLLSGTGVGTTQATAQKLTEHRKPGRPKGLVF